ncbi:MAG: STAS domain-containing protein [Clostridiales bacterium]|nr:STAS domain-containing protein [Clostridiales bacterium]
MFTIAGTVMNIHLPAEIDHYNSEQIGQETDRLIQKKHIRCLLFDFADTTFMDSSGVGMMIGRYKTMRFMGGTVMAVHVGERMKRILTLSGIYRIIDIYEDLPLEMSRENGKEA